MRHTASSVGPLWGRPGDLGSGGRRIPPANDTSPGTPDTLPRWRIGAETLANSSETAGAAPAYTTYGALLKQPDKHEYDYTELVAWQRAMDLTVAVYEVSRVMPTHERYGLTAQMRRAAAAIPANIAEGQGRRTCGEFLNQLSVAHGSLRELETHVLLARRLEMMDAAAADGILKRAAEVGRLINGLSNSLER